MHNTKCTIFTTFRNIPPCGLSTFTGWAVTTTLVHTCSHPSALQEQEDMAWQGHIRRQPQSGCVFQDGTQTTLTSASPASSAWGVTTCLSPHHPTLHWILKDPSLGGAEAAGGRHRDPAPSRAELRPLVHVASSRPASGCAAPSLINLGCYAHLPGLSQGR